MTKKGFIRQLKRALQWRLPLNRTQEVLTDYEGFFAEGIEAGQTEEALCAQFGAPKKIARSVLQDEGQSGRRLGLLAVVWFALALILGNVTVVVVPGFIEIPIGQLLGYQITDYPILSWLTVPLMPFLWLFWRKAMGAAPPPSDRRLFYTLGGAAVLLFLILLSSGLWSSAHMDALWRIENRVDHNGINTTFRLTTWGKIQFTVFTYASMALAVILLISLLWAWRKSPWYLLISSAAQGLLVGISRFFYDMMRYRGVRMRGDGGLPRPSLMPVFCGVFAAAGCAALTAFLLRNSSALDERLHSPDEEGEDRGGGRLLLLLAWPPLTLWLTRATEPLFDWSFATPFFAALLSVPALCLLWRGLPEQRPLPAAARGRFAALLGLPLLYWLALAGLPLRVVAGLVAESVAPLAVPDYIWPGIVNGLYFIGRPLVTLCMLSALAECWMASPRFLLPAVHCAGVLASTGICCQILWRMDISEPAEFQSLAASVILAYAVSWLGVPLMFLLRRIGGRHGRAA